MLSTCCTSTDTVLVLLIAAATLQLGVASPIVRRESCDFSPSETNLRDGLFVAGHIVGIYNLTETDLGNATDTDQAIEKACDLLGHYYLLNGSGIFNNSNILHIVLKQNVLDACTHWVKSGISNCTIENLTELAIKCHNRLPTMIAEAYDKTNQALLGDCPGPQRHECRWLQQILVLKECSDTKLKEALQPPYNTTSLQ